MKKLDSLPGHLRGSSQNVEETCFNAARVATHGKPDAGRRPEAHQLESYKDAILLLLSGKQPVSEWARDFRSRVSMNSFGDYKGCVGFVGNSEHQNQQHSEVMHTHME